MSLLVAWDSPVQNNGAEILSYVVELTPLSVGWVEPYVNETVTVEDAAETATNVSVGGNVLNMKSRRTQQHEIR